MILAAPPLILPPEKPALVRAHDMHGLPSWPEMQRRVDATFPFPFVPPGGASKVETIVSQAAGTAIGGMTAFGNLAAAFDGNTSQAAVNSAASNPNSSGYVNANAIGKDWGSGVTKFISKIIVTAPNNNPIIGAVRSYKLQGSTDNFSSSVVDLMTPASTTNANGEVLTVTSASIDTTVAYRYHRFIVDGTGSAGVFVCELVFYELI